MADDAESRFDRLWRDHAASVVRYAYRRVPASEVDDVVAETFVVAWRRLDEVPERALPWLLVVARGVGANAARTSRRRDAVERRAHSQQGLALVPDIADGVTAMVSAGTRGRLPDEAHLAALHRLPAADRELLTLLAWDDLSHDEAAQVVGCSRGALRVRLHRARRRFRALLAQDDDASPAPTAGVPLAAVLHAETSRTGDLDRTADLTTAERTGGAA